MLLLWLGLTLDYDIMSCQLVYTGSWRVKKGAGYCLFFSGEKGSHALGYIGQKRIENGDWI